MADPVFFSLCNTFSDFSDGSPIIGVGQSVTINPTGGKIGGADTNCIEVTSTTASTETGVRKNLSSFNIRFLEFDFKIDSTASLAPSGTHTISHIWVGQYLGDLVEIRAQVINATTYRLIITNPTNQVIHYMTRRLVKGTYYNIRLIMTDDSLLTYIENEFQGHITDMNNVGKNFGAFSLGTFFSSAVTGKTYFDNVKADLSPAIPLTPVGPSAKLDGVIAHWWEAYLRPNGSIVRPYPDGNWGSVPQVVGGVVNSPWSDVTSKSQAQGLTLAIQTQSKAKFDLIEGWTYITLDRRVKGDLTVGLNLMGSHYSDDRAVMYSWNTESHADIERMGALYQAHALWGSAGTINYLSRANAIASDIRTQLAKVSSATTYHYIVSDITRANTSPLDINPGYLDPAIFELAKQYATSGDKATWTSIINGSYDLLVKARDIIFQTASEAPQTGTNPSGLLPNWISYNLTTGLVQANTIRPNADAWGYEAQEIAYKIKKHHELYGEPRAVSLFDPKTKTFFTTEWNNNKSIKAEYRHNGSVSSDTLKSSSDYAAHQVLTIGTPNNVVGNDIYNSRLANLYGAGPEGHVYSEIPSSGTVVSDTLLLDSASIPQSAGAYSLRKLRAGYAGPAIRIRNYGSNAERDVGFTSNGELDTTAIVQFCNDQIGYVTRIYDQSGNNRHLNQTDSARMFRIYNGQSIDTKNNKPCMRALDSGRGYVTSDFAPLYGGTQASVSLVGALSAAQTSPPPRYFSLLPSATSAKTDLDQTGAVLLGRYEQSQTWAINRNNNWAVQGTGTFDKLTQVTSLIDGTKYEVVVDGASTVATGTSFNFAASRFGVGHNGHTQVSSEGTYFSEGVIWLQALDVVARQSIATNQKSFYNTVATSTGGGGGGTDPGDGGGTTPVTGEVALWSDPSSNAANEVARQTDPMWKALFKRLADVPQTAWSGQRWDDNADTVRFTVQDSIRLGKTPAITVYSIPNSDVDPSSPGGSPNADAYRGYMRRVCDAIGPASCIVIVEPDSLNLLWMFKKNGQMSQAEYDARTSLLGEGLQMLRTICPQARIYLDLGHSAWMPDVQEVATMAKTVNLANIDGISLNVSNFRNDFNTTNSYGPGILDAIGISRLTYVYDTGRNGNPVEPPGSMPYNPKNVWFGKYPKFGGPAVTGLSRCDGWLWIKRPGESDGWDPNNPSSSGYLNPPPAGAWWPDYAKQMMIDSGWVNEYQQSTGGTGTGTGTTTPTTTTPLARPTYTAPNTDMVAVHNGHKTRYQVTSGPSIGAIHMKQADFENGNGTSSEAQAYGVMEAVQMNDKPSFIANEAFTKAKLERRNAPNGTPNIIWAQDGTTVIGAHLIAWKYNLVTHTVLDWNWALDADVDRAWAKIWAYYRWFVQGGDTTFQNELAEAIVIINEIKRWGFIATNEAGPTIKTVNGTQMAFYASDRYQMGRTNNGAYPGFLGETNISYGDGAAFKMFKQVTNDTFWDAATAGHYYMYEKATDNAGALPTTNGMVPDFMSFKLDILDVGPMQLGVDGWGYSRPKEHGTVMTYDAFRAISRLFTDWWYYQDARAQAHLVGPLGNFYKSEYDARPPATSYGTIAAEYNHAGGVFQSRYEKTMMTFCALWCFWVMGDTTRFNGLWNNKLANTATTGFVASGAQLGGGAYYRDAPSGTNGYFGDYWAMRQYMIRHGAWRNWGQA